MKKFEEVCNWSRGEGERAEKPRFTDPSQGVLGIEKLIHSSFSWLDAKMASRLAQLRPGKEATCRPKKARCQGGLGFSEHPKIN